MEADQDWCLECGTAAAGRLGERPGCARRLARSSRSRCCWSVGAVAAGYAALTGDAQKPAPPVAAAPQTQAQVTTPPATTPPPPPPPRPPAATTAPAADAEDAAQGHDAHQQRHAGLARHADADAHPTPTTSTPTPTTATRRTTTTPTTGTTTTPADTGPKPIELAADAGSLYDPLGRVNASRRPARARSTATPRPRGTSDPDGSAAGRRSASRSTSGKLQGVREIKLQTPTPGFRVEVYATDDDRRCRPTSSTRGWSHINATLVEHAGIAKDDGKHDDR